MVVGPHRADIVGNDQVMVELQHSSINADDIAAREKFYGNMVWLFDATRRFASVTTGSLSFFSLGRTKHIELCAKPVFLDFGFDIVQVEEFIDTITLISGYGIRRTREWFADNFLSDVRQPETDASELFIPDSTGSDPWGNKSPVWKTKHPTKWFDPASNAEVVYPKWTEYVKLDYCRWKRSDKQNKINDHDLVIDRHPQIAAGWTKEDLRHMLSLFRGDAVILGDMLRVLPSPIASIRGSHPVSTTKQLLATAEGHISAGRLPIIKDSTKEELLRKAEQHEIAHYGKLLDNEPRSGGKSSRDMGSLFADP